MITQVPQTRFGLDVPPGNCYAAALASLMGLQLSDVPDEVDSIRAIQERGREVKSHEDSWAQYWLDLQTWLARDHGLQMLVVEDLSGLIQDDKLHCLAGGKSPRGLNHSVVWQGGYAGEVLWDPHPSRDGIAKPFDFTFLIPLDASTLPRRSDADQADNQHQQ